MKVAVIDFGSFVLPYDYYVVKALCDEGNVVEFFCSDSKYNPEFLNALRNKSRCTVFSKPVSSSVASRLVGICSYMTLLLLVIRRRKVFDKIILQFMPFWPLDLLLLLILGKKTVFVVHNSVPHDYGKEQYTPYKLAVKLVDSVWFPSAFTRDDFERRYYPLRHANARVVQHGTMGALPGQAKVPYSEPSRFAGIGCFGLVRPYKGIDRFLGVAQRNAVSRELGAIEIHGKWSPGMERLKQELIDLDVVVIDKFISGNDVAALFSRDLLFVLPHRSASQSGVLYTLLHHGKYFLGFDVGDIGRFFRESDLENLIIDDVSYESIKSKIDWMASNSDFVRDAFSRAQKKFSWDLDLGKRSV